jgi:hypothetical protein
LGSASMVCFAPLIVSVYFAMIIFFLTLKINVKRSYDL